MKTKEEILKESTKRTLNINEGSPLHDAVMKAMEEYAQEQVKLFCQPAVVGRSEQLSCETCIFNTHSWSEDYPCATCCGFDKHQAT